MNLWVAWSAGNLLTGWSSSGRSLLSWFLKFTPGVLSQKLEPACSFRRLSAVRGNKTVLSESHTEHTPVCKMLPFLLERQVGYTGCNRRNGPDFWRVFLMLNYTEKPQNTYIQSWTVWEIMTIENCGLPSGPRTIAVSWNSYLLVGLLAELQQAGVLRHHSTFQYDV